VSSPERILPDETEPGIVALHRKRYEFAQPYCRGGDVLDAGCGVGYGTALLARNARSVVGIDLDADAIAYAQRRYGAPNVVFRVGDMTALDLEHDSVDVVCAFETIEHLAEPERFVAETRRVLRDEGLLLASTPRAERTDERPANPHHEREYSPRDFESLLRTQFTSVELLGQRRLQTTRHRALRRLDVLGLRKHLPFLRPLGKAVTGTSAMADVSSSEIEITPDLHGATELIAVCRA
jgi:2-polyprenyl-3-methyl-5-hydroxy-6-metoxy-1,4-benzoquinol methylase